jgi:hypothetical protein
MRVFRRAFSLAESLVVLFLSLVVLTVVGVHLQQLTRLSLTPLDQGWESLQLGLQRLGTECSGAYELTVAPASVRGRQAGIGATIRLPGAGPSWSFDVQPVAFEYLLVDGQLVRRGVADAPLCAADSLVIGTRPNGFRAELTLGKQRVVREVYRWVR